MLDPSGPGNQGGHPHHVEQFQSHCHGTSHNHTLQWQIGQPSVFSREMLDCSVISGTTPLQTFTLKKLLSPDMVSISGSMFLDLYIV